MLLNQQNINCLKEGKSQGKKEKDDVSLVNRSECNMLNYVLTYSGFYYKLLVGHSMLNGQNSIAKSSFSCVLKTQTKFLTVKYMNDNMNR